MKTNDTAEGVMNELHEASQEAEEAIRSGGGETLRTAKARLNSALDSARETYERLQEKAVEGAKATDRTIREHPYQSLGIAFAVGLLIGVLVTRNHR